MSENGVEIGLSVSSPDITRSKLLLPVSLGPSSTSARLSDFGFRSISVVPINSCSRITRFSHSVADCPAKKSLSISNHTRACCRRIVFDIETPSRVIFLFQRLDGQCDRIDQSGSRRYLAVVVPNDFILRPDVWAPLDVFARFINEFGIRCLTEFHVAQRQFDLMIEPRRGFSNSDHNPARYSQVCSLPFSSATICVDPRLARSFFRNSSSATLA